MGTTEDITSKWYKIQNDYPNTYKRFLKFLSDKGIIWSPMFPIDVMAAHEFFDKQKIRGDVHNSTSGTWSFNLWVPIPMKKEDAATGGFLGWNRISYFTTSAYTREDAYMNMFREMFKMLEENENIQ